MRTDGEDVIRADGPASSTTAAQQEINASAANDSAEIMQWMSVVDEQDEDVADISSLPALEGLLEKIESQAGRVVTNELLAAVSESSYCPLDEHGRDRLRLLCQGFQRQRARVSREDEVNALHWRVQQLVQGTSTRLTESRDLPVASSSGDPAVDSPQLGTAKLVVPMTRRAES